MSATVTAPLVAIGKRMLGTAASFEAQMNIMALAAARSGTSLDTLSDAAIAVGGDVRLVGIDALQAAGAMTNFYKAGLSTSDIMGDLDSYLTEGTELTGALRAAIDLAAASELDLAQASDVVAVAMATFGLDASEASRITDGFVRAADSSLSSVGTLAEALSNFGPTAAAFGWSLEDTNAALAILSNSGVQGAEAGTNLKSMMTNLMRPTDKVTKMLKKLNVTLYDEEGATRSLPDIIGQLAEATKDMTDEQKNNTITTLAGTYGMKAMQILLKSGTEGWDEMTGMISTAASTQKSAAARTKGLAAAMEKLKGSLQTLMIRVGTPLIKEVLTPFVEKLVGIADRINDLDPKVLRLGVIIAGIAAAAGPALLILGGMATGLSVLLSPLGLVIAGIAGLAAGIWAFRKSGKSLGQFLRDVIGGAWDWLADRVPTWASKAHDLLHTAITTAAEWLKDKVPEWAETVKTRLGEMWDKVKGVDWVETVKTFFHDTILPAAQGLGDKVGEWWEAIKPHLAAFWDTVKTKAPEYYETVKGFLQDTISGGVDAFIAWNPTVAIGKVSGVLGKMITGLQTYAALNQGTWSGELAEKLAGVLEGAQGFVEDKLPGYITWFQGVLKEMKEKGIVQYLAEKKDEWAGEIAVAWEGILAKAHDDLKAENLIPNVTDMISRVLAQWAVQLDSIQEGKAEELGGKLFNLWVSTVTTLAKLMATQNPLVWAHAVGDYLGRGIAQFLEDPSAVVTQLRDGIVGILSSSIGQVLWYVGQLEAQLAKVLFEIAWGALVEAAAMLGITLPKGLFGGLPTAPAPTAPSSFGPAYGEGGVGPGWGQQPYTPPQAPSEQPQPTTVNIAEGAIVIHVNNGNAREVQRGVVGALRQIGMPA